MTAGHRLPSCRRPCGEQGGECAAQRAQSPASKRGDLAACNPTSAASREGNAQRSEHNPRRASVATWRHAIRLLRRAGRGMRSAASTIPGEQAWRPGGMQSGSCFHVLNRPNNRPIFSLINRNQVFPGSIRNDKAGKNASCSGFPASDINRPRPDEKDGNDTISGIMLLLSYSPRKCHSLRAAVCTRK